MGMSLFTAGLALAGCRDLVQPAPPEVDTGPQPFVRILLESLDSNLDRATITLDNSAYVAADQAGQWQAEAYLNQVSVEGAAPGTYDVHVQPVYRYAVTPEWTQRGVALGEEPVVVAYPAVDLEVRLDWPELAVLGADTARTEIHFHYELVDSEGIGYQRHRSAIWIEGDRYAGKVPWEGSYPLHLILEGKDMRMSYSYPEEIGVSGDSLLVLASPLQEHPMTCVVHGAPYPGERVKISQSPLELLPGYYELNYVVDRSLQPDSVLLLPPQTSMLRLTWRDGPLFVARRFTLLEDDMDPGTVNLGNHAVILRVTDAANAPIEAARVTLNESDTAETDSSGGLLAFLDGGSYLLSVEHAGFHQRVTVLHVEGDQETTIVLESE